MGRFKLNKGLLYIGRFIGIYRRFIGRVENFAKLYFLDIFVFLRNISILMLVKTKEKKKRKTKSYI